MLTAVCIFDLCLVWMCRSRKQNLKQKAKSAISLLKALLLARQIERESAPACTCHQRQLHAIYGLACSITVTKIMPEIKC